MLLKQKFQSSSSGTYLENRNSLQFQIEFRQALDDCLSPIEKRTLSIRYGLSDGNVRTVRHTADLMCISSEAVRKIINREKKLKKYKNQKMCYKMMNKYKIMKNNER